MLAFRPARGYNQYPTDSGSFSSLLCGGVMLRHPSDRLATHPEEGCSSTAFGWCMATVLTVWNNPAGRRSVNTVAMHHPAVP